MAQHSSFTLVCLKVGKYFLSSTFTQCNKKVATVPFWNETGMLLFIIYVFYETILTIVYATVSYARNRVLLTPPNDLCTLVFFFLSWPKKILR